MEDVKPIGGAAVPRLAQQPHAAETDAALAEAVAYLRRDDFAAAVDALRRVVADTPDFALAQAYLGAALLRVADTAGAKEHLDRAVALAPHQFLTWAKRGEYWFRLACFPQAQADLRRALALPAPSAASRTYFGRMLEEAQQRSRGSFTRTLTLPSFGMAGVVRRLAGVVGGRGAPVALRDAPAGT